MRPGEILAIRLGNTSGNSLLVDQRVYKGTFDTPKGGKGKKTSRTIALSSGTVADLELWRASLPNQEPDALLSNPKPVRHSGAITSGTGL